MMHRLTSPRVSLAVLALVAAFWLGAGLDHMTGLCVTSDCVPPARQTSFAAFWQSFGLVQRYYVDPSAVNPTRMQRGAIQGMLDTLGDQGHTTYLSPQGLASERSDLAGQLEGIGAEVDQVGGVPTVVAPLDGTPAQRAGLRPGDQILAIDGRPTAGMTLDEVIQKIRGKAGTAVTLKVLHQGGGSSITVTIVRAKINLPNVDWAMVPGTRVADVRIVQFGQNADSQLRTALHAAIAAHATGLVVDVRSDPGGLLDQAVAVTSEFLRSGNVLLQQDRSGHRTPYPVKGGAVAAAMPLVVMVDHGTASSAEIFAGALQDQKRGKLVGEVTFGTGTVLSTFDLVDGGALLLGTAEWLTPSGHFIRGVGIQPDEVVGLGPGVQAVLPSQLGVMTSAQVLGSGDAQLLKAVSLLGQTPSA
jgi:carboxyl-terminal processing protease